MDPQLTRLYQDELDHLREQGREFAREHPKIAGRLGLENMEVADPYVERLLEGFAFLTARIRLKLDAEQPRLIAQLLEALYPNFLAPVPSMMVVRLAVDTSHPNLASGHAVPRHSAVQSLLPRGQDTCCEFRTAMALTLWPLSLVQAQYFSHAPDLGLSRLPAAHAARGGLRIRLRTGGGLRFSQLKKLDRLALYLSAPDDVAFRLHELVLGQALGSLVVPGAPAPGGAPQPGAAQANPAGEASATSSAPHSAPHSAPPSAAELAERWRDSHSVQPLGLADDEALLPETLRVFSGHRLLQEVAALPQRLLFFEITGLAQRLAQVHSSEVELVLLFARADAGLEALVDGNSLALHCTPAINLFRKRLDRVALGPGAWEFHAVPDRVRPMDFELHSLESVTGHGGSSSARPGTGHDDSGAAAADGPRRFAPLYSSRFDSTADSQGYYTLRREPRRASDRQRQQGARVPSYLGEEVFLSLLDSGHGPYRETLRQLSVSAWVSNRDLPVLLPQGVAHDDQTLPDPPVWRLDASGPVQAVVCLRGPTRPVSRQPSGPVGWQLVSQLMQHQLALGDDPLANAAALRALLLLHGPPRDGPWAHQVAGLHSLRAEPVVRRLPMGGPLSFASGMALTLEVDEAAFNGASAFVLGMVLETFFARHAAINSFSQFSLHSSQRGLIRRWPPRIGRGPTL